MLSKIAADIRFMQLYAHNAHNLVKGPTFFQDHEFLGELYPTYEAIYDSLIERMIGLGEQPDLIHIQEIALVTLKNAGSHESSASCFKNLLQYEKYICDQLQQIIVDKSEGTKQLLGEICNQSEIRQYKLKQRASE